MLYFFQPLSSARISSYRGYILKYLLRIPSITANFKLRGRAFFSIRWLTKFFHNGRVGTRKGSSPKTAPLRRCLLVCAEVRNKRKLGILCIGDGVQLADSAVSQFPKLRFIFIQIAAHFVERVKCCWIAASLGRRIMR